MTDLLRGETQALFYMFCAGISVMILFFVRNYILNRCHSYRRICDIIYFVFWILAGFLFYEFAYAAAYGCVYWYSLASFAVGIILWNKKFCGIITLYNTVEKQDRDKKDEKKNKGTRSKIRRKKTESGRI